MARIEDSLQILLDSYLEAPNTFSDEGYLPIHLACIYYPTNVKVVDIIMRANPSGVIEPVSFNLFQNVKLALFLFIKIKHELTLMFSFNLIIEVKIPCCSF